MEKERGIKITRVGNGVIPCVSGSVSDDFLINGSGLFHWNSSIKKDVKLKMIEWYNNLSSVEQQYIDDFRHEAAMDEYDSHCGEEL
jgi:hypothetical protein